MINIQNSDCLVGMKDIASESIDVILTDPPYKYLKNQKLEVDFNETEFFEQVKRVLKKDGFIVLFGRGTSFYRWNTMLADMGFNFKEEIIWDKRLISSPLTPISRKHETISMFTKGSGTINRVKIPYIEAYKYDSDKIIEAINRIKSTFGNRDTFEQLKNYYKNKERIYNTPYKQEYGTTMPGKIATTNRTVQFGISLEEGVSEKSIISEAVEHYNHIHPTQKPVRLLERLLALVSKEGDLVCDTFSGSYSTAVACINTNRNFIGYEIDAEYFDAGKKRVESLDNNLFSKNLNCTNEAQVNEFCLMKKTRGCEICGYFQNH